MLEAEKEDLQVNCAVMKAEKHNAISALETYKKKQQNVTEEMAHLYKLNSEQAIKITDFEKEKKLNTEEFAYLYKTKNDQAEKLKEFEKQETDLSQFHKTISDQAIKISELEKQEELSTSIDIEPETGLDWTVIIGIVIIGTIIIGIGKNFTHKNNQERMEEFSQVQRPQPRRARSQISTDSYLWLWLYGYGRSTLKPFQSVRGTPRIQKLPPRRTSRRRATANLPDW